MAGPRHQFLLALRTQLRGSRDDRGAGLLCGLLRHQATTHQRVQPRRIVRGLGELRLPLRHLRVRRLPLMKELLRAL